MEATNNNSCPQSALKIAPLPAWSSHGCELQRVACGGGCAGQTVTCSSRREDDRTQEEEEATKRAVGEGGRRGLCWGGSMNRISVVCCTVYSSVRRAGPQAGARRRGRVDGCGRGTTAEDFTRYYGNSVLERGIWSPKNDDLLVLFGCFVALLRFCFAFLFFF